MSSETSNELPFRQKNSIDGALPSGNSAAFGNLLRLAWLTGNTHYIKHGVDIGRGFNQLIQRVPQGHAMMLAWNELLLHEPVEVIVVGKRGSSDTQGLIAALREAYLPNMVVLVKYADDSAGELLAETAPFSAGYSMVNGKATAYVCRDFVCNLPTNDVNEMISQLREGG